MKHLLSSLLFLFFAFVCRTTPAQCQTKNFSQDVLVDAFEKGRSLLIVKILAVGPQETLDKGYKPFIYEVQVIKPVVLGDLDQNDIKKPMNLFAGASFGDTLKVGSLYALFVVKNSTRTYSWAHRSNVVQIDAGDSKQVQDISESAQKVYGKTSVCQFRQTKFTGKPELPPLPQELVKVCEQFKEHPNDRAKFARLISDSPLASRQDKSEPFSSNIKYLRPEIVLTRHQILFLLGEPTVKAGRTYTWFCGEDQDIPRRPDHPNFYVGVLRVNFDEKDKVSTLLYGGVERSDW